MVRKNDDGGTDCEKCALYVRTEKVEQNKRLAKLSPSLLLRGEKPSLIDERQVAPALWDSVRFEADHSDSLGLFILTGSFVPADMSAVIHSGTGRIGWLRMRPMSLWESEDSTGEVSLSDLFTAPQSISGVSSIALEEIAFLACRGGWPLAVGMDKDIALDQAFDYFVSRRAAARKA